MKMELETAPFKPSGQSPLLRPKPPGKLKHYMTTAFLPLLVWGSAAQTDATLMELVEGLPNMLDLCGKCSRRNGAISTTFGRPCWRRYAWR